MAYKRNAVPVPMIDMATPVTTTCCPPGIEIVDLCSPSSTKRSPQDFLPFVAVVSVLQAVASTPFGDGSSNQSGKDDRKEVLKSILLQLKRERWIFSSRAA